MNRRSWGKFAIVAASLGLVAASCGGDDDDAAPEPSAVESTAGSSSAPADSAAGDSTPTDSAATTAAPSGTAPADDVDYDATLRFGMELAGRTAFDPTSKANAGVAARGQYQELLYDTMIRQDADGNPLPGLATEWSAPDDFTVELTLRDGVTFHDGTPFDAEAVKFSWDRCINGTEHLKLAEHAAMESVDVVDPMTVRINLSAPVAGAYLGWVLRTANYCIGVVSPTAVQELGEGFEQAPVGAGPYQFVSYDPDQKIVLERYEDHWQPGYFTTIEIDNVVPGPTMITGVASDQFDLGVVDASLIEQAEGAGLAVEPLPSASTNYLYLCWSDPALGELAARQAIARAIDRDEMVELAFGGYAVPNEVFLPPQNPYHAADLFGGDLSFDLDEAKRLAQESGLAGQSLDIQVQATSVAQNAMAEVLQQQLARIDVDVNLVPTQNALADKAANKPATEVWGLTAANVGTAFQPDGVNNYCQNPVPEIVEAYTDAWRSLPDDEVAQAWHDFQAGIQASLPMIPLVNDLRALVQSSDAPIEGLNLKESSYVDLRLLYRTN